MRIIRIHARIVRIQRMHTLTTSYGATPYTMTVVVDVAPDESIIGLGQTTSAAPWYGDSPETIMTQPDRSIAPAVIGLDPSNIEDLVRGMDRALPGALYAKCHPLCGST